MPRPVAARPRPTRTRPVTEPPPVSAVTDVPTLVRSLIKAAETSGHAFRNAAGQLVLLDLEVDGVKCTLLDYRRPVDEPDARPQLSPREKEIVRMVAKGYANKTIARVLDISCWTVGTYLRRIFAKLGVGTRAAMIAKAHHVMAAPEPSRGGFNG